VVILSDVIDHLRSQLILMRGEGRSSLPIQEMGDAVDADM